MTATLRAPASLLLKILRCLEATRGKDYTRPAMCGVHIHADGDAAVLVTSDGHALIRVMLPRQSQVPTDFQGSLGETDIKVAMTLLKLAKESEYDLVIPDMDLSTPFPPYTAVIPERKTETQSGVGVIGFMPELVARVFGAIAKLENRCVAISVSKALDPIRLDIDTGDVQVTAVIMPTHL